MKKLEKVINAAFEHRDDLGTDTPSSELTKAVAKTIDMLDTGQLRVAENFGGDWLVSKYIGEKLGQTHDKPFFLAVGFVRPHVPYTAPKEFFDLYPLEDIVMPDVPIDEMDDIPLLGKAMAYGTIQGGDHQNVLGIGPDYWRELVRAYLACVSFADAQA
ncbi:MAG: hypothetical protein IH809_05345, partial [Proteobacteria bacterium]|nr:hypothetical protein [Pseudomonadota bacterium]